MIGANANYNGEYGLYENDGFAYVAYGGHAEVLFANVTASYNGSAGIGGDSYFAYGEYMGAVTVTLSNIRANYNGAYGIYFYYSPAYSRYGDGATTIFSNVTASYNTYAGIYAGNYAAIAVGGGDASLIMTSRPTVRKRCLCRCVLRRWRRACDPRRCEPAAADVTAMYNSGYGIYFGEYAGYAAGEGTHGPSDRSWAFISVSDSHFSYNSDDGFHGGGSYLLYAVTGSSIAEFSGVTAIGNSGTGFQNVGGYANGTDQGCVPLHDENRSHGQLGQRRLG